MQKDKTEESNPPPEAGDSQVEDATRFAESIIDRILVSHLHNKMNYTGSISKKVAMIGLSDNDTFANFFISLAVEYGFDFNLFSKLVDQHSGGDYFVALDAGFVGGTADIKDQVRGVVNLFLHIKCVPEAPPPSPALEEQPAVASLEDALAKAHFEAAEEDDSDEMPELEPDDTIAKVVAKKE